MVRLKRGGFKEGVPDNITTYVFSALFTRQVSVRVLLDRFKDLKFCRCGHIGESGWSAGHQWCIGGEYTE